MKGFLAFGMKYSKEKYTDDVGYTKVKMDTLGWYGNSVKRVMKKGPILLLVGEKGIIDAGVMKEDLHELDIKELRQIYLNKFAKPAEKVWIKDTILEKLA